MCTLLVLASMSAAAQTYKCKRPDGKTSFQDQPCETTGAKGGPVVISDPSPSYSPPATKAPAAPTKTGKMPQAPGRQDDALHERNRQLEAQNHAMACSNARNNLAVLQRQRPVYHVDKNGQKQYVEDSSRDAEIAAAQRSVAESCK